MVRDGIGFGGDDGFVDGFPEEPFERVGGLPPFPFPMPSGKNPHFTAGLADEILSGGLGDKRINLLALFGNARFMDRTPEQVLDYFVGENNYSVDRNDVMDKETGEISSTYVLFTVPNVLQHMPKPVVAMMMDFCQYSRKDPLQGLPLNSLFDLLQIPRQRQEQVLPPSKAVIKFEEFDAGETLKTGYAPRGWRLELGHKGDERHHTLDVKLSSSDYPSPVDRWSVHVDRVSYNGPTERLLYERKPKK